MLDLASGLAGQSTTTEWDRCSADPAYFINTYVQIYDAIAGAWVPFKLWNDQATALDLILNNRLVIILKARQIGMTWLVLAYSLWLMLFRPAATVLLFSRRDDEAIDLLDFRLKGMYKRLPPSLQSREIVADNKHEWQLASGSRAMAFPTTAGDSYTATLVVADEFDLVVDQQRLLGAVKPTVDNGGQMILVSRTDKRRPQTAFKQIYRAAKQQLNDWAQVFLPWYSHPGRDQAWYDAQRRDILHRTNSLDDLHEQYPATDTEALAPRTLDKRIAPPWLEQCYQEREPLAELPPEAPSIPELRMYRLPEEGREYVCGADPAEGNPTSDDSAATWLDRATGEEVASLAGKFQPSTLAAHVDAVGRFFNRAPVLVERNNHGHAVLLWLRDHSTLRRLDGHDDKEGWNSNSLGKALLYEGAADAFREQETNVHSFRTLLQLQSIEGSTLRAPEGEMDDLADSYALALAARASREAQVRFRWL